MMPNRLGSKFKLKNKLKLPIKRAKPAAKDDSKWVSKIKPEKERISKPKKNDAETDGHLYKRESIRKRNIDSSSVKDEQFHLNKRESNKGAYGDEGLQFRKKERSLGNVDSPNTDTSSVERMFSQNGDSVKERGRLRGKTRNVELPDMAKERNFGKDDLVKEKRIEGVGRSSKMYSGRNDAARDSEGSGKVEYSANSKLRSKVRNTDKRGPSKRFEDGDENDGLLKKHVKRKSDTHKRAEDNGLRLKMENVGKRSSTKRYEDGGENDGLIKRRPKTKSESNKRAEPRRIRHQDGSFDETSKKMMSRKRGFDDGSDVRDDLPRKSKRVIRIDKHDISNKRIDDSVSSSSNVKIVEKDIEVSKNAQFRAIQPSPSILSFVEDNLLGRRRLIDLRRSGYDIKLSVPLDNIPFSTSSERDRIEESVFRNKLTFFAAAKVSSSFPPADLPEIAFAGRSNVGKSSLLNALTRQWGVVRTSDKPGLTQTINFFKLASKLCLVDLPGYGFAYAKEEVKDAWEELVKEYVSSRVGLKRVCLLVDTKWGMKPRDHELIDLMERSKTQYQIVLTKTDVVFPINVARRAMQIEESLKSNKSVVNPVQVPVLSLATGLC